MNKAILQNWHLMELKKTCRQGKEALGALRAGGSVQVEEAALGIHSEPAARPSLHLCGSGVTLTMLRANRKALSFTDGQTLSQEDIDSARRMRA